jgi:hypothetical protein
LKTKDALEGFCDRPEAPSGDSIQRDVRLDDESASGRFFFLMKKRLHCPWIPEFGTDNGFRGYHCHSAPVLKSHYPYFLSDTLVVSYVLSSAEPVVSTRCCAYTAQAGAVQRQNGFAIPIRASSGRMIHLKRNQGYLSFWKHAKWADRPTTYGSAKRYTRVPLRPGRRPAHPTSS